MPPSPATSVRGADRRGLRRPALARGALSNRVRLVRRRIVSITGDIELSDGSRQRIDAGWLIAAEERASGCWRQLRGACSRLGRVPDLSSRGDERPCRCTARSPVRLYSDSVPLIAWILLAALAGAVLVSLALASRSDAREARATRTDQLVADARRAVRAAEEDGNPDRAAPCPLSHARGLARPTSSRSDGCPTSAGVSSGT